MPDFEILEVIGYYVARQRVPAVPVVNDLKKFSNESERKNASCQVANGKNENEQDVKCLIC